MRISNCADTTIPGLEKESKERLITVDRNSNIDRKNNNKDLKQKTKTHSKKKKKNNKKLSGKKNNCLDTSWLLT